MNKKFSICVNVFILAVIAQLIFLGCNKTFADNNNEENNLNNQIFSIFGINNNNQNNNESITLSEIEGNANSCKVVKSISSKNSDLLKTENLELTNTNSTITKYYEITNNVDKMGKSCCKISTEVKCNNREYFDVSAVPEKDTLKYGETTKLKVTIKLKKPVTDKQNVDYTIKLKFNIVK